MPTLTLHAHRLREHLNVLNLGSRSLWAVVKARCYGLGWETIPLLEAHQPFGYCVATIDEGEQVRKLTTRPILVLNDGLNENICHRYETLKLTPLIWTEEQRRLAITRKIFHHILLNTGMNRLGLSPEGIYASTHLQGIHSHLVLPEHPQAPITVNQVFLFNQAVEKHPGLPTYALCASGGVLHRISSQENSVRVGISLYTGGGESSLFSLSAPVLFTQKISERQTVNYGLAWHATKETNIAIIGCGYADGLSRAYGFNNGQLIDERKQKYPIIGTVCMDICTVINHNEQLKAGDIVQIIGNEITPALHGRLSGRITYEILTGLGSRAAREISS